MAKLRTNLRKHARWLLALGIGATAASLPQMHPLMAQTATQTQMSQPSLAAPFGEPPDPNDPMQRQRMAKLEKSRNVDRQKQLERDTEKLLTLATELKTEVGKSNKDTLSIDVVKKAAEIEKLAKSVKDRMRG